MDQVILGVYLGRAYELMLRSANLTAVSRREVNRKRKGRAVRELEIGRSRGRDKTCTLR